MKFFLPSEDTECGATIAEGLRRNTRAAFGTKIDVVLRWNAWEFWYYETKTASSPRACLREALGQVME